MSTSKPTINKLLSLLLVLSVVLTGLLPSTAVYASEVTNPGSGKSTAVLSSDGLIMDVTVPTSVLIYVDENGEVTTPDYLPIINNSIAPVFVHSLTVTPKNGWTLDPIATDYTNFKVNQKNYWIAFNGLDPSIGPIALATPINGSDSLNLFLSAGVAPQRTAISGLNIGEIVITLGWDAVEGGEEGNQGIGNYVLATDEDFEGEADGEFHYIGSNPYVIIPDVIKGVPVTQYTGMFEDTNVKGVKSDNPNITTMARMFKNSQSDTLDLSGLDTSSVKYMHSMFEGSQAKDLDISNFNTSNVENVMSMFKDSRAKRIDIRHFNLDKVTEYGAMMMFENAQANVIDMTGVSLSNVTNFDLVFKGTQAKTIILEGINLPSITSLSGLAFNSNAKVLDLSSIDTTKATNIFNIFENTSGLTVYVQTQADKEFLETAPGNPSDLTIIVKDENTVITYPADDESDDESPDYDPADYPDGYVMPKNSDWMVVNSSTPIYQGNDDYIIIPASIDGTELTGLNSAFQSKPTVKGVYVNNPNITTANSMFQGNTSTSLDLQYINIPNAAYMQSMFENTNATTLDLTGWDVSNLHSADKMFKNAEATEIVLSGLNFESLNQATEMFAGVNVDTLTLKGQTFGANEMFKGATIDVLDLSEFKFQIPDGSIHTMDSIFKDVFKDATIGTLYVFDRDQAELINRSSSKPAGLKAVVKGQPVLPEGYVLALDRDFSESNSFTYRKPEFLNNYYGFGKNVTGFEHDKFVLPSTIRGVDVTSYQSMMAGFYQAGDENKLPTHFKSSNPAITDMSFMFQGYPTATLNLDFNTVNVTNMEYMFSGAKATILDLSGFNVDKVETMSSMFNGAEAATIDISSFKLADTQPDVSDMFKDAEATTIYVRSQADIDYITANHGSDLPANINFVIK
ncbi:BspA family leucine-rich repeat surface protein [Defluviitalea phaphyphila]|uniref:BspA family leucine-rich repeat surface protein n=1 Tax=Defluviitalea phaphyphila TaxID=1473580 RepID=UPI00073178D7|nr:BspA family leucine-rich repeat surface protein [Defluviitalea phaphyphila]